MGDKKILLSIDGNNLCRRMLHGSKPLSHKGQYTHAIYGALSKIKELTREYRPSHLAICFDMPGKNFRHELYEAYKGNRDKSSKEAQAKQKAVDTIKPWATEATFRWQMDRFQELIPHLGWHSLGAPGYEADDFMGSCTVQFVERYPEGHAYPWGGDKDFAALVRKNITHLYPIPYVEGMPNTLVLDRKGVMKKFAVKPSQMADYLAMMGDHIDNIPGVKGIGPVTAVKLLAEYGSLREILRNLDDLTPAVAGHFRKEGKKNIRLWMKLVKINCELPVSISKMKLHPDKRDDRRATAMFKSLGFKKHF